MSKKGTLKVTMTFSQMGSVLSAFAAGNDGPVLLGTINTEFVKSETLCEEWKEVMKKAATDAVHRVAEAMEGTAIGAISKALEITTDAVAHEVTEVEFATHLALQRLRRRRKGDA